MKKMLFWIGLVPMFLFAAYAGPLTFNDYSPVIYTCECGNERIVVTILKADNEVYHQDYLVPDGLLEITDEKVSYAIAIIDEAGRDFVVENEINFDNDVMTTAIFEGINPVTNRMIDTFETLCLYDGPPRTR